MHQKANVPWRVYNWKKIKPKERKKIACPIKAPPPAWSESSIFCKAFISAASRAGASISSTARSLMIAGAAEPLEHRAIKSHFHLASSFAARRDARARAPFFCLSGGRVLSSLLAVCFSPLGAVGKIIFPSSALFRMLVCARLVFLAENIMTPFKSI